MLPDCSNVTEIEPQPVVLDARLGLARVIGVTFLHPNEWRQEPQVPEIAYVDHIGPEPLDMLDLSLLATIELNALGVDPRTASQMARELVAEDFRRIFAGVEALCQ